MIRLVMLAISAALLLLPAGFARAQTAAPEPEMSAPAAEAPSGEARPAAEEDDALPMERYGESDKACRQWSDGCRACGRGADGVVACSNIGIACQPAAVRCTAQDPPAGK
jgi:hypothetical protein